MKQITPEIKQRIFALYWGQRVWMRPHSNGETGHLYINADTVSAKRLNIHSDYLSLFNLSSITDEDAIEVAKIEDNFEDPLRRGKALIRDFDHILFGQNLWSAITDFLRSKGYALPAFGFSVDELVEAGIFKLKEVNND